MNKKTRIIFHIDMDHFYTAVEEREHSEYKGKPVVVGADPKGDKGRGVVSTSNYEARKVGIRSGMPISRAWRLCPEAIYLKPNFSLYEQVSREMMDATKKFADTFEQWGIDEAFLDVTSRVNDYSEAEVLARQLKHEVRTKENLSCSIGIGPNKLIAKIASDYQKPDGLTVVRENEVEEFLAPLPVRRLLWVGRKTEALLKKMGIKTIGDLANYDPTVLTETLGMMGAQMYASSHGIDYSKVESRTNVKSISHETTFEIDTSYENDVLTALDALSVDVVKEVVKKKLFFKTVTIKFRYANFETHTSSKTLAYITDRLQDLQKTARKLLSVSLEKDRKVRLIGVRVSNFVKGEKQRKLM
jgi:DNA polymerase IV (DinB-like DNA polymerase)